MNKRNMILVTGAGGYLGKELIRQLLRKSNYTVLAMSSRCAELKKEFLDSAKIYFINRDINALTPFFEQISIVYHLSFARKNYPLSELLDSLEFSHLLFRNIKERRIPALVNISSQSVYGFAPYPHVEDTKPSPNDNYAFAKSSLELILKSVFFDSTYTRTTNIRLDSIAGNKNLIPNFVKQAFENQKIKVIGGSQIFSLLDVRDAASGLISLAEIDCKLWKPVYNLGWNNKVYGIIEIASIVKDLAEKHGAGKVEISIVEEDIKTFAGIDSSSFIKDTKWKPKYNIYGIIENVIINYLESKNK